MFSASFRLDIELGLWHLFFQLALSLAQVGARAVYLKNIQTTELWVGHLLCFGNQSTICRQNRRTKSARAMQGKANTHGTLSGLVEINIQMRGSKTLHH